MVRRVSTRFTGREVEFVDRETALRQLDELADRGTRFPLVIYGPEGCGKTALLRQARALLEDHGYHVVYVNPLAERMEEILEYTPSVRGVVEEVLRLVPEPYSRIVDVAINIAGKAMRSLPRPKIAVLMDDIFQAVGTDKAEIYVKALLNLIEWPPADYEKAVVLVTSSEGVTRERVGRHNWAVMYVMWNMPRDGFQQLYDLLPGPRPPIGDVWGWTGGNPRVLERLHEAGWNGGVVVRVLAGEKGVVELVGGLSGVEREVLLQALEDPDVLLGRYGEAARLVGLLTEKNLIVRVWDRDLNWVDTPPPERDPALGIGRHYAWQTPMHREAVRRALMAWSNKWDASTWR